MTKISRRKFIKNSLIVAPVMVALPGTNMKVIQKDPVVKAIIPMPLQVVIDDVGWWSGEDGSKRQEPYRTGIGRNHVPADYLAIASLGKSLGIRPQAAMIMCEWDKGNILKDLPNATWMGKHWDNSKWIGPWMEEAADIIKNNRKFFELTIHGIGHEYWENGSFTRAEWADKNGKMRPPDQMNKHLDYYEKLLEQHSLGPLPSSFVPTAFCHCFGKSEGRDVSLAEIFSRRGINYINTPFQIMGNRAATQNELFGIDSGVLTIDRGEDEFSWDVFPGDPKLDHKGPTYGIHWPNLLNPDPGKNTETVEKWVKYLKQYNDKPDRILSSDSVDFQQQLVHRQLTGITQKGSAISFDFTKTDSLTGLFGEKGLTVKIQSSVPLTFKTDGLKVISESSVINDGYLHTLKLSRQPGRNKAVIHFSIEHA